MAKTIRFEYGGERWEAKESKVGASIISLEPNAKITNIVVSEINKQQDGTYQVSFWPNSHPLFSKTITVEATEVIE